MGTTPCMRGRALMAVVTTLFAASTFGQTNGPDTFQGKTAAELLRSYEQTASGSPRAQELLIGMLAKHLAPTEKNAQAIQARLTASRDADEMLLLIRVLSSMHTPQIRNQLNQSIEATLRALTNSADRRVAAEAVIEYSRFGDVPHRYELLQMARHNDVLSDDGYYGELAHGLRFASTSEQAQTLAELERANNRFANDILATTFSDQALLAQLSSQSRAQLLHLLIGAEPSFPLALDRFGLFDAVRYSYWLGTVTALEAASTGQSRTERILSRLSDPRTDPRKILAVFISPEGQSVIREAAGNASLHALLARSENFAQSLPQNPMLQSAAASFNRQLSSATENSK